MDVEIIHEAPTPPRVKGLVLRLSRKEAQDLLALASIKDPFSITRATGVRTHNVNGTAELLQFALRSVYEPAE